ncbi:MAG: DNA polymerase III subunit delta [Ruminococcus sp.]|nr:DNA polymerase III subunit delta [Ruminococcus sp.]
MFTESELKKHLNSGHFSSVYLCFGEEKMLVKRSAELIEKKITGGDINEFNYHVFDNDSQLSDIAFCADMIPFMGTWNILRINDMDIDKLKKDDCEALMKVLKNASGQTVIIIAMPTLDVTSKTAKAQMKKLIAFVDKNGVCIELSHRSGLALERDLCKWAKAGGCTMSELTAHQLIQFAGEDLNRLNAEMKKLTAFADGGEITPEMIELLVSKTAEASVYDLFGLIAEGKIDKALSAIDTLFYQQISGVYICTVLSGAYLDAYRARAGAEAGKPTAVIAEDFGYKNRKWVLDKLLRQIRRVTTTALRKSIDELLELQTRMVTETVDERMEIESLICRLVLIAEDRSDE